MHRITSILSAHLNPEIHDYGFASLRGLLSGRYARFTHGMSIVRRLDAGIVGAIGSGPTREYFDHYHAVNAELNELTSAIATALSQAGIAAEAVTATGREEQLNCETLTADVSHKMVATRAGLGWIGKTDLLVTRRFGPRVRLASILTDFALPVGIPIERSQCGSCDACVNACPAQAATGGAWTAGATRESFFNPFKCRDYCRKVTQARLNEPLSLCGLCVHLCPHGKPRKSGEG